MDMESIERFFKENGVVDRKQLPHIKNFYGILDMIHNRDMHDVIMSISGEMPRNPYKRNTTIKPGKCMVDAVKKRASGAATNNKLYKDTLLEYYTAIFLTSIMIYKMGHYLEYEEVSRLEKVYEELKKKSDKLSFDLDEYESDYRDAISVKGRLAVDSDKYRENIAEALEVLSDDIKSKELFHKIVEQETTENMDAYMAIIGLVTCAGVNINEKANVNASIIRTLFSFEKSGIESYDSAISSEEYRKGFDDSISDETQEDEYYEILNRVYEKSLSESQESGKPLSLCLYENLNLELVYNTTAFSWSQDNKRVREIINHHRSKDINESNNAVTCHTWSSAMRELYSMAGFDAYIVGEKGHQFVLFFNEEDNVCVADGTNPPDQDRPNWFQGADLTRSKLGLAPNVFYQVLGKNEYLIKDDMYIEDGAYKKRSEIVDKQKQRFGDLKFNIDDYRREDGSIDYKAVFGFVDNNPDMMYKFAEAIKESHDGTKLVEFLNEAIMCLVQGHEEDDLLITNCVSNLVYILKGGKENCIDWLKELTGIAPGYDIGASHDLYKKIENRTKMVPLIYVKGREKVDYYIWDDTEGFINISKEELLEKINSGEYHSSKNNDSKSIFQSRMIIPGIRSPRISKEKEEKEIFGEGTAKDVVTVEENGWVRIKPFYNNDPDID